MNNKFHPREDHGFFGPGSPTWTVWSSPALLVAMTRAIVLQMFDPVSAAGVAQHSVDTTDPKGLMDRNGTYFQAIAFGDGRTAIEASEALVRVHENVRGIEPVSGRRYVANDPEAQLWVHLTGWHSALYACERYGSGELSPADEARYWRECAIAAELQTCDPALVPRHRDGVREYFASMLPKLCVSDHARTLIDGLLYPPLTRETAILWPATIPARYSTIALLPRSLRRMAGIRQPKLAAVAVRQASSVFFRLPSVEAISQVLWPTGIAIRTQALQGPPPLRPTVVTPAHARAEAIRRRDAPSRSAR